MIQYGAITPTPGRSAAGLTPGCKIAQDMETLITQFQPDEMSIEELFFSKEHHHRHRRGPCPGRHSVHR